LATRSPYGSDVKETRLLNERHRRQLPVAVNSGISSGSASLSLSERQENHSTVLPRAGPIQFQMDTRRPFNSDDTGPTSRRLPNIPMCQHVKKVNLC